MIDEKTNIGNPHNLISGQKLYLVYGDSRRGNPRFVEIASVGRKFATLTDSSRLCLKTLRIDGGTYSSPATCYFSKEEYTDQVTKQNYWRNLCNSLPHKAPAVTMETLKQVASLLGLNS